MSKLTMVSVMILISLFTACGEKQERDIKAEKYFIDKVEKLLQKSNKIETDFTDLVKFKWDKVCFTEDWYAKFTFSNSNPEKNVVFDLSDKRFKIQEDYVKSSPGKKCFRQGEIFIFEKIKNMKDNQNDILIKVKG